MPFAALALASGPEDKVFKILAFKVMMIYWSITQAMNNWIMFINCHRKQGFTKYYEEMNELADKLKSLNVTVNTRKLQRNHIIFLVVILLIGLVNGVLKIWDLSTNKLLDPIFGWSWNNRNNSEQVHVGVKVFSQNAAVFIQIKYVFYPACFSSSSYYCWHMLAEFNKAFSEKVEKSACDVVLEIETYRTMHLKLCKFVNRTNKLFYIMLGNSMLNCIATMIMLLSLLATPSSRPATAIEIIATVYWILGAAGLSVLYIRFSQNVYDEASFL